MKGEVEVTGNERTQWDVLVSEVIKPTESAEEEFHQQILAAMAWARESRGVFN